MSASNAPNERSGSHDVAREREWETWWIIERPGDSPGRPLYWIETGDVEGVGTWTEDPWAAARYLTEKDADRIIRKFVVHPTILDARPVSHGFEADRG